MTIDKMIEELEAIREEIGGDHEVAIVRTNYGENDYLVPEYGIIGNFVDQDGSCFRCAFIANIGGEEFTEKGVAHYKWKPDKKLLKR